VFLLRGKEGLNIDFVGGTSYTGELAEKMTINDLRDLLGEKRQQERLKVASVEALDPRSRTYEVVFRNKDGTTSPPEIVRLNAEATPSEILNNPKRFNELRGEDPDSPVPEIVSVESRDANALANNFKIHYQDGSTRDVELPNLATPDQVKARAEELPDLSVQQIFVSSSRYTEGDRSSLFTVRTSEKAPELVQIAIDRLLGDKLARVELTKFQVEPIKDDPKRAKDAVLFFADYVSPTQVRAILEREFKREKLDQQAQHMTLDKVSKDDDEDNGRLKEIKVQLAESLPVAEFDKILTRAQEVMKTSSQPERLENFDSQLALDTQQTALYAILASWGAILLYLWFRFGNWTFGMAAVLCLIHDLFFTLGIIAFCHYIHHWAPGFANLLGLHDFKIDLAAVAALLTLVGYSVNDTIVVFDRIREVRGKNPELTPKMINDSVNQTLSRTLLTSLVTWLVVLVLYIWGGEGVHLFAFVMVVGVIVGTYSSIYIASPLLLIFGEGARPAGVRERQPEPAGTRG
jgi:SecD/SecF fusion protein